MQNAQMHVPGPVPTGAGTTAPFSSVLVSCRSVTSNIRDQALRARDAILGVRVEKANEPSRVPQAGDGLSSVADSMLADLQAIQACLDTVLGQVLEV